MENNRMFEEKTGDVAVYNIIPDEVRALLEPLDLEEEDANSGDAVVKNIIPDELRALLEPLDLSEENE